MDKLADGLQKLGEDDLLQVVQMVHDNKSSDSYTKNDIERRFSGAIVLSPLTRTHVYSTDMSRIQRANSMLISTLFPTPSSRCCGTSHKKRELYEYGERGRLHSLTLTEVILFSLPIQCFVFLDG